MAIPTIDQRVQDFCDYVLCGATAPQVDDTVLAETHRRARRLAKHHKTELEKLTAIARAASAQRRRLTRFGL